MQLRLERPVHCDDGPFGELVDILLDPATSTVTHVAVEPHHRHWQARLVPIELLAGHGGADGALRLSCTLAEAASLEHVEQAVELPLGEEQPAPDPGWDVGAEGVQLQPPEHPSATHDATVLATYDRIPKGEIEIRRVSEVRSADGEHVGRAAGLVIDGDAKATHLVVEHGHLLGRHETSVPMASVATLGSDAIALTLTKTDLEP